MTHVAERLVELRRHLDHLREIKARVAGVDSLHRDFSLRNDVLFSLLMVCQLVIDVSGELSAQRGERFEDYTAAVRSLAHDARFSPELVLELERLPGFRNVVIHEYVVLSLDRVVEALDRLEPVDRFLEVARAIVASS